MYKEDPSDQTAAISSKMQKKPMGPRYPKNPQSFSLAQTYSPPIHPDIDTSLPKHFDLVSNSLDETFSEHQGLSIDFDSSGTPLSSKSRPTFTIGNTPPDYNLPPLPSQDNTYNPQNTGVSMFDTKADPYYHRDSHNKDSENIYDYSSEQETIEESSSESRNKVFSNTNFDQNISTSSTAKISPKTQKNHQEGSIDESPDFLPLNLLEIGPKPTPVKQKLKYDSLDSPKDFNNNAGYNINSNSIRNSPQTNKGFSKRSDSYLSQHPDSLFHSGSSASSASNSSLNINRDSTSIKDPNRHPNISNIINTFNPNSGNIPEAFLTGSNSNESYDLSSSENSQPNSGTQTPHNEFNQEVIPRPNRIGRENYGSATDLNVHSRLFRQSVYSISSASLSRASIGGYAKSNRMSKTLLDKESAMNMYREAALKTNDERIQLEYAKFLISSIETLENDKSNLFMNSLPRDSMFASNTFHGYPENMTRTASNYSSQNNSLSSLQIGDTQYENSNSNKAKLVKEAVYWIKLLQKKGNAEASYILGCWIEESKYGIPPDKEKANRLYMQAAKSHHAKAAFKVAENYENKKLGAKAVSYYKVAAAMANSSSNYRMATSLLRGELGQRENIKQALIYLRRSAELADKECPDGSYVLGVMYLGEYPNKKVYDHLFKDTEEAHKLLDKAAQLGMPEAQNKLGFLFEFGEHGFPADPYASIMYYKMATEQNFPLSQMALSGWYLSGAPGILEQSDSLAFDLCSKAAEQGLLRAMFGMGYYYDIGIGVEKDQEKAIYWYRKAADGGSKEAIERLKKSNGEKSKVDAEGLKRKITKNSPLIPPIRQ
ncbi:hypothetical protein BB559_004037 [Furculomyces boomerangus]|uniref:Uncharacterized protein n=1 Tax=Furculomyces boomerangus TaxID=61424 RepID=A0A2T9YH31_9FUNG|nr:hypothetical protein BB559_004037 [Furculomyces boomerangus]